MKRYIISASFMLLALLPAAAQSTLDEVLRSIEAHNPELQAESQRITAQKLQNRMENNLPDPSVSYTHQYGNREGLGVQGELVASQSFDFPTVYVQRHRLAEAQGKVLDRQQTGNRQQILLQAQEICLDLVLLNQQKKLFAIRRDNAEQLAALYEKRISTGDATQLEMNKVALELLNARTEAQLNESARLAKLQELAALNGGTALAFEDTVYATTGLLEPFDHLRTEALASDPQLEAFRSEEAVARRQLRVSRSLNLPGLELGYRLNTAAGGERFNGFLVGVSIPLFSNRGGVRQAKAQQHYAELKLASAASSAERTLQGLYTQAVTLKSAIDTYDSVLQGRNSLPLLNKAIRAGQISMVEYFVDAAAYYQGLQNYLQLQNQYQKVMAQLYKHRL